MEYHNLITILGGSYAHVKKALKQWIALYQDDLEDEAVFTLHHQGRQSYAIIADKRLDNQRFFYLLNYLAYPEGIDYNVVVEGYTQGEPGSLLEGKGLFVYLPEDSQDKDDVGIVTYDGQQLLFSFDGRFQPVDRGRRYRNPASLNMDSPEVFRVNPRSNRDKNRSDDIINASIDKTIAKRFLIIASLFVVVTTFSYLMMDEKWLSTSSFFIFLGMLHWFLGDYKMLRVTIFYLRSLGLAVLLILYNMALLRPEFIDDHRQIEVLTYLSLWPFSLLLIQRPARWVFIRVMKREPVTGSDQDLPDFLYLLIMIGGSVLTTLSFMKFL